MLDLILNTRVYDLAYIYQFADIGNVVNQALLSNNKSPVSIYERNADRVNIAIQNAIDNLMNFD